MIVVASPQPKPPVVLSAQLSVALTDVEKTAVQGAAKAAGLSMSAWGRLAITTALRSIR